MKNLRKIFTCLVLALFTFITFTACNGKDGDDNDSPSNTPTKPSVLTELSQIFARELYTSVAIIMQTESYTLEIVDTNYVDHTSIVDKGIIYNENGKSMLVEIEDIYVDNGNVKYSGERVLTKFKVNGGEEKYYLVETFSSDEAESDVVKTYMDSESSDIGFIDYMTALEYITGGYIANDGFIYLNYEDSFLSGEFKIKDGKIIELTMTFVDSNTNETIEIEKTTFNYNNLPPMPTFPETLEELIEEGYVEGSAQKIIADKYK